MAILETGGMFSKKDVSVFATSLMMNYEWRHLSRSYSHLRKDTDHYMKDVKKHNINQIAKDMGKIENDISYDFREGYKLAFRDLLLLRRAIYTERIFARTVHENIRGIQALEAQLKKDKDPAVKRAFEKLLDKQKHAEVFVQERLQKTIADVHSELKNDQKIIFDLVERENSHLGVALAFKGNAGGFARMMQLRLGALRILNKDSKRLTKYEEEVFEDWQLIKNGQNRLLAEIHQHPGSTKSVLNEFNKERKELDRIVKKTRSLFLMIEGIIKSSYKVFLFDFMILRATVDILNKEIGLDEELITRYEIPRMLGMKDINELKQKKDELQTMVENLEKLVLQIYNIKIEVK